MIWPQLVPDCVCTMPIRVIRIDGIDADGAPVETDVYDGMCNYSEHSRDVSDAERHLTRLEATALINGDPFSGQSISGTAIIGNGTVKRKIYRSSRARNPDGSVNYTKLELM